MPGHVVALSSFGADKPDKTGPIAGVHRMEERLLLQAGAIQQMGATAGPLNPDLKIPMIAARDIGTFAANELLGLKFRGHQTQELLGQREAAYSESWPGSWPPVSAHSLTNPLQSRRQDRIEAGILLARLPGL